MCRSPVAHTKCWLSTRLALRVRCINYLIHFFSKTPFRFKIHQFWNSKPLNVKPPPPLHAFFQTDAIICPINITNFANANLTGYNGRLTLSFKFSLSWKEQCTISNAMQCELKIICNVHEHVARVPGWANWAEKCAMCTIWSIEYYASWSKLSRYVQCAQIWSIE